MCILFVAHDFTSHEIWFMELLSGIVTAAVGVSLIGLAFVSRINPPLAERFLKSFASSARAHYIEQASRLIAGAAICIACLNPCSREG